MATSYPMSDLPQILPMTSFLITVTDIGSQLDALPALTTELGNTYRSSTSPSPTASSRPLSDISSQFLAKCRTISSSIRALAVDATRDNNDPGKQQHVVRLKDRLREQTDKFRLAETDIRNSTRRDFDHQFRIVAPTATDDEINQSVEQAMSSTVAPQIFATQTLRRADAQQTLVSVQSRHAEIEKIEQDMTQLQGLFAILDATVDVQGESVAHIEQSTVDIESNMSKAVHHLTVAEKTARATRRQKWYCLGLVVLIILLVVAAVLIWYFVAGPGKK